MLCTNFQLTQHITPINRIVGKTSTPYNCAANLARGTLFTKNHQWLLEDSRTMASLIVGVSVDSWLLDGTKCIHSHFSIHLCFCMLCWLMIVYNIRDVVACCNKVYALTLFNTSLFLHVLLVSNSVRYTWWLVAYWNNVYAFTLFNTSFFLTWIRFKNRYPLRKVEWHMTSTPTEWHMTSTPQRTKLLE